MLSRTFRRTVLNLSNLYRKTGCRPNPKCSSDPAFKVDESSVPGTGRPKVSGNSVCRNVDGYPRWDGRSSDHLDPARLHASLSKVRPAESPMSSYPELCMLWIGAAGTAQHRYRYFSDEASQKGAGEREVSKFLEDAASYNEADDPRWATVPYPEGAPRRLQGTHAKRPKIDPADTSLILFPGQGTLRVGAVKEYLKFPGVKDLFEAANEAAGYDLLKICLEGPQRVLDRTEYNQTATVVSSLAALEKLREERPRAIENCVGVAGYSVGELTALIFAGVMSVEAGLRLVAVRGAAMQVAAEMTPQGMMSVYCAPDAKVPDACKKAQTWAQDTGVLDPQCRIAIFLYPQGRILAGNKEALRYIEANGRNLGFRRIQWLPVSGAFHTKLMQPALEHFRKALQTVSLQTPRIPVHSNIDGKKYENTRHIIKLLPKQIVSPVKWEQTMHVLYERPQGTPFPRTFDVGSGGSMKTILKQSNARAWETCFVV